MFWLYLNIFLSIIIPNSMLQANKMMKTEIYHDYCKFSCSQAVSPFPQGAAEGGE